MKKSKQFIIVKKPPKVGIEPCTFGFIEVNIIVPGSMPKSRGFLGPYEWIFFDNNKLFIIIKIIYTVRHSNLPIFLTFLT